MSDTSAKPLTGRKVLLIAIACFGTVIAANLTMLFAATGTFPGLVVKNSYVEGQGWNDRMAAQKALGWTANVGYADGILKVDLGAESDAPLRLIVGRPSSAAGDVTLVLAAGERTTPIALAPGLWRVEIDTTDGPAFHATAHLTVSGD